MREDGAAWSDILSSGRGMSVGSERDRVGDRRLQILGETGPRVVAGRNLELGGVLDSAV